MNKLRLISVCLLVCLHLSVAKRLSKRYIRSDNAKQGAWPWQVLMVTGPKDYNICGASLINAEWVLTVAHCVRFDNALSYKLVFGEHDRSKKEGTEIYQNIAKIVKNPKYETQNHSFDIALLKLEKPIDFNDPKEKHLKPIKLDFKGIDLVGRKCIGTGWGREGLSGVMPDVLQQLEMKVYNHSDCARIHEDWFYYEDSKEEVTDNQVCFVSAENPYPDFGSSYGSVCNGDSGSPLQCLEDDKKTWIQIGVAWSATDCEQNPSIFQLVHKYKDFIKKTITSKINHN